MGDNTKLFAKKTISVFLCLITLAFVYSQDNQVSNEQVQSGNNTVNNKEEESRYSFANTSTDTDGSLFGSEVESQSNSTVANTGSSILPFINMILVLVAVIACIYGIVWLLRKSIRPGAEKDPYLKKTASITLAPGKTVQIVTLQDKAYLLGVSDSSITLISEINDKEFVDTMNLNTPMTGGKRPADFASILASLTGSAKKTESFLKSKREKLSGREGK